MRLMLDSHPDLAIPSETHFLFTFASPGAEQSISLETLYQTIVSHFTWRDFGLEAPAFRQALAELRPFDLGSGLRTFYSLYASRHGKRRWGEKTPDYGAVMPQLQAIFPEARFIHIIRDGRDVALSKRHLWFGPGSDVRVLADDWVQWIMRARSLAGRCTHYMEVRYEDLVTNPEGVLRSVCEFIDLPFYRSMLQYYEHAEDRAAELQGWPELGVTADQLRSLGELTKLPPQRSRVGRWRSDMTDDERRIFEDVAGPLLLELGYDVDRAPWAGTPGPPSERMNMLFADETRQMQVEPLSVPEMFRADETREADVAVSNLTARPVCSAVPFPVHLAYHWIEYDTGRPVVWDGDRTRLEPPVAPSQKATYHMRVTAPSSPGDYLLQLALVQEGVRWFDEADPGHGCKIRVRVEA